MGSPYKEKIKKKLEAEGFFVINLIRTNHTGIMDLLAVKPGPNVKFVESKEVNDRLRPDQKIMLKRLTDLGFDATCDQKSK
jgi:hypothetical protein